MNAFAMIVFFPTIVGGVVFLQRKLNMEYINLVSVALQLSFSVTAISHQSRLELCQLAHVLFSCCDLENDLI